MGYEILEWTCRPVVALPNVVNEKCDASSELMHDQNGLALMYRGEHDDFVRDVFDDVLCPKCTIARFVEFVTVRASTATSMVNP